MVKEVKDKKGVFGRFLSKTHTALSIFIHFPQKNYYNEVEVSNAPICYTTHLHYAIVIFVDNFSTTNGIVLLILHLERHQIVTISVVSLHEDYYLKAYDLK